MSGGISATTWATLAVTAATTVAAASMAPKPPAIQAPTQPPKPQAAKGADRNASLAANVAATMPGGSRAGNSGTFLTGSGGVDSGSLNLGKNQLLGQ
jgi:hypothetical protein